MKFQIKWNKRKIKEEKNYRKINSEVRRLKKSMQGRKEKNKRRINSIISNETEIIKISDLF